MHGAKRFGAMAQDLGVDGLSVNTTIAPRIAVNQMMKSKASAEPRLSD